MIAASVKFQSLPYSNEIVKLRRKKEEKEKEPSTRRDLSLSSPDQKTSTLNVVLQPLDESNFASVRKITVVGNFGQKAYWATSAVDGITGP